MFFLLCIHHTPGLCTPKVIAPLRLLRKCHEPQTRIRSDWAGRAWVPGKPCPLRWPTRPCSNSSPVCCDSGRIRGVASSAMLTCGGAEY